MSRVAWVLLYDVDDDADGWVHGLWIGLVQLSVHGPVHGLRVLQMVEQGLCLGLVFDMGLGIFVLWAVGLGVLQGLWGVAAMTLLRV